MIHKRLTRGFTLIELLAVITVLGILATLAVFGVTNATRRARDAKRQSDIAAVKQALELYQQDNGAYPAPGAGNTLPSTLVPNYMKTLPTDPRPNTSQGYVYYYAIGGGGTDFVVADRLENTNLQSTLTGFTTCTGTGAGGVRNPLLKGNGTLRQTASYGCFRVSND